MLGSLSEQQIEQVLRSEVVGRIGCTTDNGRVYVVPITYAYDSTCIYGHSGDGMKLRAMRAHPSVCFEVEHIDSLANWRSVIAWGSYEELEGDAAEAGMRLLIDRLMPLMASETSGPPHRQQDKSTSGQHAAIYRIRLTERTGRYEKR